MERRSGRSLESSRNCALLRAHTHDALRLVEAASDERGVQGSRKRGKNAELPASESGPFSLRGCDGVFYFLHCADASSSPSATSCSWLWAMLDIPPTTHPTTHGRSARSGPQGEDDDVEVAAEGYGTVRRGERREA